MPEEHNALTPSAEIEAEKSALGLVHLLLRGEEALHEAAGDGNKPTSVLPRNATETADRYEVRKCRSRLVNFLADAINEHVDRVYQNPPQLGEDVPREIKGEETEGGGWAENIDRAGRHLDVFGKDLYKAAKPAGIAYILVDKAPPLPGEVSSADSQRAQRRPYFIQVDHSAVLEASTRTVLGEERLAQFRFIVAESAKKSRFDPGAAQKKIYAYYDGLHTSEASYPPDHPLALDVADGGGGIEIPAGDARRFASFEVYRVEKIEGKEVPVFERAGVMKPLTAIPVSPLYLNRTGAYHGAAPYYVTALASTTLEHFQKKSDLDWDLHVVTTPLLHRSGHRPDDENPQTKRNPEAYFWDPDPQAKMTYVAHDGAAIGEARADLKDTEARAKLQSREPLMQRTGTVTATSDALATSKANSTLEAELIAIKDCLELALGLMMEWEGKPPGSGGSIVINKEGLALAPIGDMSDLRDSKGHRDPDIDRRTYLREMKRRGKLDKDTDIEAIIKAVDEELPAAGGEDPEERLALMEERLEKMAAKAEGREPEDMGDRGGNGMPREEDMQAS